MTGQLAGMRWVSLAVLFGVGMHGLSSGAFGSAQGAAGGTRGRLARSTGEQSLDEVPLKGGVWEVSLSDELHVVDGPFESRLCPDAMKPLHFFPALFAGQNFGRPVLMEVMSADSVGRMADGRYRVTGGEKTARGGEVGYVHLIALHGDESYEDALTVTSHLTTHPVRHFYMGRGHWVGPCALKVK